MSAFQIRNIWFLGIITFNLKYVLSKKGQKKIDCLALSLQNVYVQS